MLYSDTIIQWILRTGMLADGDRVICGVSGGADSVFLFYLLKGLREMLHLELHVVHVHHGIRGQEADRDAEYVRKMCEQADVPFSLFYRRIPEEAAAGGLTLEEAGRNARREIFREVAAGLWEEAGRNARREAFREAAADGLTLEETGRNARRTVKIAVAHHKNDLAESVLFRIARGTGVQGLAAMRPVSVLEAGDGVLPRMELIRPLLWLSRQEIEAALRREGIYWCEDSTNAEDDAVRNRIRHHILPAMEAEVNSAAVSHMAALAEQAGEATDFLLEEIHRRYPKYVYDAEGRLPDGCRGAGLSVSDSLIRNELPAMQSGIVHRALAEISRGAKDLSRIHVEDTLRLFHLENGKALHLPCGIRALRTAKGILLYRINEAEMRGNPCICAAGAAVGHADPGHESAAASIAARTDPGHKSTAGHADCSHESAAGSPDGCAGPGQVYTSDSGTDPVGLVPGGSVEWQKMRISADFQDSLTGVISEKRYTKTIDYGKIKDTLVVRTRRPGDFLTVRSDGARKKLSDYFTDEKIPRDRRDRIPLLADGNEIVWVIGRRLGYRYRVSESTDRFLTVSVLAGTAGMEESSMDDFKDRFSIMISEEEVNRRIRELGEEISRDYAGKSIHMICVLKGGVYFMTMLSQQIHEDVPVSLDFMSVSSYGNELKSSGVVKIVKDLDEPLQGKDVIVVEDIIDSGRTLYYLLGILKARNPASLRLCTLLDKPDRRERDVRVDYTGFVIEDKFVLGCGMDYCQKYRNLPYIAVVND